jgi:hypothetical protein
LRWNTFPKDTKRTFKQMTIINAMMGVLALVVWRFLGAHDAIIPAVATAITALAIVALYFTVPFSLAEPSEADDIKFLLEQLGKKYEDRDFQRIDAITNRLGK